MSKKKVKAKARKDKYYQLAKETGYRARSAFKLLQLNKKFGFLQSSQVLVDLCAAPGGWLQVASEHMPMSSIIIGVDLVPIRPIPRCITFQDDITKESCRSQIKTELHGWKVDCFLNDGAPNVGKNWLHDAYSQSVLTLYAVKLASEFLRKGGWFVTKVFRSKDYQSLMWVFNQLFTKVHATKPQASRNVSAEIFVVCQGYKSPDKIDKKFFDPKAVFQDIESKTRDVNILDFEPKKKKQKAKGYIEERDLLFKRKTVSEFLACPDPLKMLSEVNELVFETDEEKAHPLVTKDIIENIKDIKCLGKKDIKILLGWHKKIKKENQVQPEKLDKIDSEVDSDEEIDRQLQEIKEEEAKSLKKKKKTVLKEKNKLRERMSHMAQATAVQEDMELFALDNITDKNINEVLEDENDEDVDSDVGSISSMEDDSNEVKGEEDFGDFSDNEEITQSKVWFSKDIFRKIEDEQDENDEVSVAESYYKSKKMKNAKEITSEPTNTLDTSQKQSDSDSDSDSDIEDDVSASKSNKLFPKYNKYLDPESLALGTVIATSKKRKQDVIDDSFNRYTFNDGECDLPEWFVEDEKKRICKTHLNKHISKDLLNFYKSREMKINDRTIKKVAEAKARKKRRQLKKLEKVRKQAEGITDSQDMSNKEKAAHVKNIYKKAGLLGKRKEHTTYVFAKKGVGKKVRRPPGVSGKFKVVDKRLKKDIRHNKGNNKKTQRKR